MSGLSSARPSRVPRPRGPHPRRRGRRGIAVRPAARRARERLARVGRMALDAAVVVARGRLVGLLLDRPPDDVDQPSERDLQGEHQPDESPVTAVDPTGIRAGISLVERPRGRRLPRTHPNVLTCARRVACSPSPDLAHRRGADTGVAGGAVAPGRLRHQAPPGRQRPAFPPRSRSAPSSRFRVPFRRCR